MPAHGPSRSCSSPSRARTSCRSTARSRSGRRTTEARRRSGQERATSRRSSETVEKLAKLQAQALRARSLQRAADLPGARRRRQGRHDPRGDERRQPAGCQVFAFKAPNAEELDHDFLWRVQRNLPERGRIGVWNRSHYEEVLVVRVHPELPRRPAAAAPPDGPRRPVGGALRVDQRRGEALGAQRLPSCSSSSSTSRRRSSTSASSIASPIPTTTGSSTPATWRRASKWDEYMERVPGRAATRRASRGRRGTRSPPTRRATCARAVAEIVVKTLDQLELPYPVLSDRDRLELERVRRELEAERGA